MKTKMKLFCMLVFVFALMILLCICSYADNRYLLNNYETGQFLMFDHNISSSPGTVRGTMSSLGNSVVWELVQKTGGYAIVSADNSTLYLSVPTSSSSSSISVTTVSSGSSVPTRCLWTFDEISSDSYTIRNVYNSRYLAGGNFNLSTSTTSNANCSWRKIKRGSYVELPDTFYIKPLNIKNGSNKTPAFCGTSGVSFASPRDFTFSGYNSSYVSVNSSGAFVVPSSFSGTYSATITAMHKVTGKTKTFSLVIRTYYPKASMVAITGATATDDDPDGRKACLQSAGQLLSAWGYSQNLHYSTYMNGIMPSDITGYINDSATSIFISRSHGFYFRNAITAGTYLNLQLYDASNNFYSNTFDTMDIGHVDLMLFCACYTGYGGEHAPNLPSRAVNAGATVAVGFEDEIDTTLANEWTLEFLEYLEKGYSVESACHELSLKQKYHSTPGSSTQPTGVENIVICR